MRRTELSGEKYNSRDRDRDQTAHQISGLLSQDINDSHRQQPKKIGSLLSLSRRRLAPDPRSPNAHQQPRSSKNIVENLYMLTTNANNQHQPDRRQRHVRLDQTSPRQQPRPQQERRREESGAERQVTPTRGSLLRNRNSRDKSRVRGDKSDSSRGRYRQGNEQRPRGEAEREIRKLEEKYLENVY